MYRKIIFGILVAVGIQVSSLGMEKEKTEILVSYNKNFVTSALANGKLVVTPSNDNTPFSVIFEDNLFTIPLQLEEAFFKVSKLSLIRSTIE